MQLTAFTERLGKSGQWLKPRQARIRYGEIEEDNLEPDHLLLLRGLVGFIPRYNPRREIDVPAQAVERVLESALHEAILIDSASNILMARGEPRPLVIDWQSASGRHRLGWTLAGEPLGEACQLIETGAGYWYCDLNEGLMGEVECAFNPAQVRHTLNLPALDDAQREQLEAQIVEDFDAPPVLALSAAGGAPTRQGDFSGKRLRVTGDPAVLEAFWDYDGGLSVQANPERERSFLRGERLWLIRDVAAETAATHELCDICEVYDGLRNDSGELRLTPPPSFDWVDFSLRVVPQLQSLGWEVELPEDRRYVANDVFDISVDMDEESPGGWWFEVGFSVEHEGRALPLIPILGDWIRRYGLGEGPLEGLADDELFPLSVDDDRGVWRVPVRLLRPLIHQFADLIEAADGDRLQLPAAALDHVDQVLDDLPTVAWSPPPALAALADKLRESREPALMPAPPGFGAELRPYQSAGVGWLQFLADTRMNGVLADDMGLGKTVQTLAHICYQHNANPDADPVLVVAPTSVVGNWRRETVKFAPQLHCLMLHGPQRSQWFEQLGEFDLVLTSYALLQRDIDVFKAQPWSLVVLDEAQWIKNPRAKTAIAAKSLQAERRLCLSGTPMENHTGELWSLFDFLMPGFLGSEKRFKTQFRTPIEKYGDRHALARLRGRTAPFVLRRSKQLVADDLPARNEMVQSVEMGTAQKTIYEAVRARMEKKVRQALAERGLGQSHIMVLEALLKLRQCCSDPRLLPGATKGRDKAGSAKLDLLMELLPTLVEDGRRVLIFSQFTTMLGLIADKLKHAGIAHIELTGKSRNRDKLVERFQSGEVPVFLISLKAGGVGLNLTAADTVIIYDPWWNPAVEQQAIDRAHRIGQDKSVFVYRLIAEGSIEEKILQLQESKRALTSGVMEDTDGAVPSGLSEAQVLELLQPV